MKVTNILSILPLTENERQRIRSIDPGIELKEAGGWFDGEIRETWPPFAVDRYLPPNSQGSGTREERDRLLSEAEVILGGWPFPNDLRARSPKLKWFHQRPAGASNLKMGDLWGSDVLVTTSRGAGNTLAMAEYALSGVFYFSRGLGQAEIDRSKSAFDHRSYRPLLIDGKTVCVVGVGGIGREVGRLCSLLGMRVVGTKRSPPNADNLPAGFSAVGGSSALTEFIGESDFVVICSQWTPETTHLFNSELFAKMKKGSVLINVARGEIIDEAALASAIKGEHLRGAMLDVYQGEFEHAPIAELWNDHRVLITPHLSGNSDNHNQHRAVEVFCENLQAYLSGQPLQNVIDWERGY